MFQNFIYLLGGLGPTELIIILFIILLLFGARKIPDLAKGLGRGVREFKDASREISREINESDKSSTRKTVETSPAVETTEEEATRKS